MQKNATTKTHDDKHESQCDKLVRRRKQAQRTLYNAAIERNNKMYLVAYK